MLQALLPGCMGLLSHLGLPQLLLHVVQLRVLPCVVLLYLVQLLFLQQHLLLQLLLLHSQLLAHGQVFLKPFCVLPQLVEIFVVLLAQRGSLLVMLFHLRARQRGAAGTVRLLNTRKCQT